jgi:phage head maturation protease
LTLQRDARGLGVEILPPDTQVAHDVVESIRRRDLTGMSFAFKTIRDDWHMEGDMPIRSVLDMTIREVSIVTFPAYHSPVQRRRDYLTGQAADYWSRNAILKWRTLCASSVTGSTSSSTNSKR